MTAADLGAPSVAGPPLWIATSLDVKEGRDPLGLQTTTQDRLMPRLLPGILELSRRARYFAFHAFLLDKYRELRLPPDLRSLSTFIKAREWEYGLAVLNCPHDCGSSPVGAQSLRAVLNRQNPPFPRGESVESPLGGYGLYYRSPLAGFGIVARAGTMLGDTPTTVDVLYDTPRAGELARTFGGTIEQTEYAGGWMLTSEAIPLDVLVEYAESCCLCQLRNQPEERAAVHEAMFGDDPLTPTTPAERPIEPSGVLDDAVIEGTAAVRQRRRSVAHYLSLIPAYPAIVDEHGAYREALWELPADSSDDHLRVAGQWAGLVAKDVWQDALCSVWSEFCRTGLAESRASGTGLAWGQVRSLASGMTAGPPSIDADTRTADLVAQIAGESVQMPTLPGPIQSASLEDLRRSTVAADTAMSGLVVLLELHRRAATRGDAGWLQSASLRSAWQASLATVLDGLSSHLDDDPTVAETLWWVAHRFIVGVHERIAYSKLPEHTFRFRWEDGRVRFFDNGVGRFPLAAVRNEPLALLTGDLDLWERDSTGPAVLTSRGAAFISETFP